VHKEDKKTETKKRTKEWDGGGGGWGRAEQILSDQSTRQAPRSLSLSRHVLHVVQPDGYGRVQTTVTMWYSLTAMGESRPQLRRYMSQKLINSLVSYDMGHTVNDASNNSFIVAYILCRAGVFNEPLSCSNRG
jgi:hypothetical protein